LFQSDLSELCKEGRDLVLGEGNPDARLVFVGEAPGGQEERTRRPFVGPAGQILNEALAVAGLSRDAVWITNIVKCRPVTPGLGGRLRNRTPTAAEVKHFLPWLLQELQIIEPAAIVALGATAASALLSKQVKLTRERGEWFTGPDGIPVITTYHPAYLLRRVSDSDQRFAELASDLRNAASRTNPEPGRESH
jgi:DNA polymerase